MCGGSPQPWGGGVAPLEYFQGESTRLTRVEEREKKLQEPRANYDDRPSPIVGGLENKRSRLDLKRVVDLIAFNED